MKMYCYTFSQKRKNKLGKTDDQILRDLWRTLKQTVARTLII